MPLLAVLLQMHPGGQQGFNNGGHPQMMPQNQNNFRQQQQQQPQPNQGFNNPEMMNPGPMMNNQRPMMNNQFPMGPPQMPRECRTTAVLSLPFAAFPRW